MSLHGEEDEQCDLCDAFAKRSRLSSKDVKSLATGSTSKCPYYRLHEALEERILGRDVWDLGLAWEPSPWDPSFYALDVIRPMEEGWADIHTVPGSLSLPGIPERPDTGLTNDSAESWSFIQQCRNVCKEQHAACQATKSDWLPPRLLHIESESIRLVDTTQLTSNTSYVALSYCWGPSTTFRTLTSNIAEHRFMIPWKGIPNVVKDAIAFTEKIGERYIWIDRLCILQDDAHDWATHVSIMDRVYSQAELTVCAVSSGAVEEAFLGLVENSKRHEMASTLIELDGPSKGSPPLRVCVRPKSLDIQYTSWSNEGPAQRTGVRDSGPLDTRGWTFQERFLSRRCIRYEPHQITWECATVQRMEMFPCDTLAALDWRKDELFNDITLWPKAVLPFTGRYLTRVEDRLPAIGGLASRYQKLLGRQYYNGLWEGYILSGLCWEVDRILFTAEAQPWRFSQVCINKDAPSWSWASVVLPIIHQQPMYGAYTDEKFHDIKIVEIARSPESSSRYYIKLRAPLVEATLQRVSRYKSPDPEYQLLYTRGGDGSVKSKWTAEPDCFLAQSALAMPSSSQSPAHAVRHFWRRTNFDDADEPSIGETAPVRILPLEAYENNEEIPSRDFTALILSPTDFHMTSFERIGTCPILNERVGKAFMKAKRETSTFCLV